MGSSHLESHVLGVRSGVIGLAHHNDYGRDAAKDAIARTLVILPLGKKRGQAVVERVLVDCNVGHGEDALDTAGRATTTVPECCENRRRRR